jgi:hypothetical protein
MSRGLPRVGLPLAPIVALSLLFRRAHACGEFCLNPSTVNSDDQRADANVSFTDALDTEADVVS